MKLTQKGLAFTQEERVALRVVIELLKKNRGMWLDNTADAQLVDALKAEVKLRKGLFHTEPKA